SQGIHVQKVKLYVFVFAAFGSGLVGALYYLNALRISPASAFDLNWVVIAIFIVVIGGIGTLEGPIVGTIVYFALRELLADYGSWYLMALGLCAVLIMIKWPRGIWGTIQHKYDLRFFPVQRRVRVLEPGPRDAETPEAHRAPSPATPPG